MKNSHQEARRWFFEAQNDLGFLKVFFEERLGEGGHFNIGCFIAQQAGEKALKACLYALGERVVLTHSLRTMVEKLVVSEPTFGTIHHEAARLDRLYIPTRYPNGWPDGSPFQYYTFQDFEEAYEQLKAVFGVCEAFLREKRVLGD